MKKDDNYCVGELYFNVGFGFTFLLSIIFFIMKICKLIDWTWIWIVSPIWIYLGINFISVIIILIYLLTEEVVNNINKRKK